MRQRRGGGPDRRGVVHRVERSPRRDAFCAGHLDRTDGDGSRPRLLEAATLLALSPDQPTGARPTETTCSGTRAVVGVTGPGQAQDVLLFGYVDGQWQPVDEAEACAAGDSLPAAVVQSVCDAG
ncbi:hypothetical protein [Modestobacter versicolor]|uniref:Uncharacterized protein n=1 Tax=Modestobacter versicolor TaxID=429133 RepID=A0A323VCH1_9ACTN|nr:hypothetical protein [Modestobacter versicolor]MBB3678294.1 hypothetical protein [Modestobacter versicolor]PZA22389.1 hypothetical protein DMO24_05235 [Modestobacter versicolor]